MKDNTSSRRCKTYRFFLPLLMVFLLLSGCSAIKGLFGDEDSKGKPPEQLPSHLISEGMEAYNVGNYTKAIKAFEQILNDHPFCEQALLAELKAADAHYYDKSYEEAKQLYQEFEKRHPTNEAVPYVIFQQGMCDFVRCDRIDRDVSGAKESIRSFSRLLRTFPNSPYTNEAQARILLAKEFLANHEYYVATFYVRKKKYDEASHRLKYLLAVYPDLTISPKARELLKRLEDGDPPKRGLSKWLPEYLIPESWN